jgi:hypothetical protein
MQSAGVAVSAAVQGADRQGTRARHPMHVLPAQGDCLRVVLRMLQPRCPCATSILRYGHAAPGISMMQQGMGQGQHGRCQEGAGKGRGKPVCGAYPLMRPIHSSLSSSRRMSTVSSIASS